uniref:Uncharacterized protein n=1 Tax=Seriola lalandi dorsalis TaxID=1841481 RepID=A0A3B4WR48_SERLL
MQPITSFVCLWGLLLVVALWVIIADIQRGGVPTAGRAENYTNCTSVKGVRIKRSTPTAKTKDYCLLKYGGVEINYTKGAVTGFQFDLCAVINCGTDSYQYRGYDVYGCTLLRHYGWCENWDLVFTWTGIDYVCFNNTAGGKNMNQGRIDFDWCGSMVDLEQNQYNASMWGTPRANLFWYCGGYSLYFSLPINWSGVCANVRLIVPMTIVSLEDAPQRKRRDLGSSLTTLQQEFQRNNPTYIDSIGVPRGVPDEYKLIDQVAAGIESFPLFSALFPITVNKNVDRINYVHYNVLKLSNATDAAIFGLAEQLAPTSLMTLQNRMALDYLLAEKGGACFLFGQECCVAIPNNTAPDGSVTRALAELRALSATMHEHSGVDNPLDDWFNRVLGKYKNIILSMFTSKSSFTLYRPSSEERHILRLKTNCHEYNHSINAAEKTMCCRKL